MLLPRKDDRKEERRAEQRRDRADGQRAAAAERAGERVRAEKEQAPQERRRGDGNAVILPEQTLCHVRADDADKADDAEARYARRRHQRGEQQRKKAQARNVHAHAARSGVAAQKGIIPPRERGKHRQPRRRGAEHEKVGLICCAAEIAEIPHDRGGKADVRGVKLQKRRCRRPDRADGDAREHHDVRRKRLHATERENEQNGKRRKEKGRHARGERVHPGGVAGKIVARGEKAPDKHGVRYAHRGGRGHRVRERRLHDETGDRECGPGDERREHARHAD